MLVARLQCTVTTGHQTKDLDEHAISRGDSFDAEKTRTETLKHAEMSQIKYDLIGKIAEDTALTRLSVSVNLAGLDKPVFAMFRQNPEEFINKAIKLIKEEKATMIVEHFSYDRTQQTYDSAIFTAEKGSGGFKKAFQAKKHIQLFVFTNGTAEKSRASFCRRLGSYS
jgi:type III restriction enzyme